MTSRWYRYLTARSHLDAELHDGKITAAQHSDARRQLRSRYARGDTAL